MTRRGLGDRACPGTRTEAVSIEIVIGAAERHGRGALFLFIWTLVSGTASIAFYPNRSMMADCNVQADRLGRALRSERIPTRGCRARASDRTLSSRDCSPRLYATGLSGGEVGRLRLWCPGAARCDRSALGRNGLGRHDL